MQNTPDTNALQESSPQSSASPILPKFNIIKLSKKKSAKNNEHPGKRWGHSVVIHDNRMILFGGRHNQRSLATLYSLDFSSLTWSKIEAYGQCPPARDSHSVLMYKSEMIIFGGSGFGKKLNDLWSFSFDQKRYIPNMTLFRWTKIFPTGSIPPPIEGHCVALVRNCFMMAYGGLDESENDTNAIYLLDLRNNYWILATSTGLEPALRDSQSCAMIDNTCYIFGGQDSKDQRYNDMHLLNFDINETDKLYNAVWSSKDIQGQKPPARTSHSSIAYRNQYVFIIGGEGDDQLPLNDIWVYDVFNKEYTEIKASLLNEFEGRLCHSTVLFNEIVVIYGGMKNVDETLDNLILLCFESQLTEKDISKPIQCITLHIGLSLTPPEKNQTVKDDQGKASRLVTSMMQQEDNSKSPLANESSSLLIKAISENKITRKEVSTDTYDLNSDNMFVFSCVKERTINDLLSWSFLKEMSSIHQWPLGCIGHLIQNALASSIKTHNVFIDMKRYNTRCYPSVANGSDSHIPLMTANKLVLSIKDDGIGIPPQEFNEMLNSTSRNSQNEFTFLTKGMNLKLSSIRLSNGLFIISKCHKNVSIGLLSKNIQKTLDFDFLVTPVVQWTIQSNNELRSSLPFWSQTLNLILQEISFLFPNKESLYDYIQSFPQGTHLFLYDLKQILLNREYINQPLNFELCFDFDSKDIRYYSHLCASSNEIIDTSLRQYLSYMFLTPPSNAKVFLLGKEIDSNPYYRLKLYSKQVSSVNHKEIQRLSMRTEERADCISIDNFNECKGFLFPLTLIEHFKELKGKIESNEDMHSSFLNGVLLYRHNVLVCRLSLNKFGGSVPKKTKQAIAGYIELCDDKYELLANKMEIKDKAQFTYLSTKILQLYSHLNS